MLTGHSGCHIVSWMYRVPYQFSDRKRIFSWEEPVFFRCAPKVSSLSYIVSLFIVCSDKSICLALLIMILPFLMSIPYRSIIYVHLFSRVHTILWYASDFSGVHTIDTLLLPFFSFSPVFVGQVHTIYPLIHTSPYMLFTHTIYMIWFQYILFILTSPHWVGPYNLATHSHQSIHTVLPYYW